MDQLVNINEIPLSKLSCESVFQSPFWSFVKAPLWSTYAFSYKTKSAEGTFLILVRKIFLSYSIAYIPFNLNHLDCNVLCEIAKKVKKVIKENVILLRFDLPYYSDNFIFNKKLHRCKYSIQPESSIVINLTQELSFKKRVYRNLKKEEGVAISLWNGDDKDFSAWYDSYVETSKRDNFQARSKAYIKKFLNYNKGDVKPLLYLAKYQEKVIGGILNLRNDSEEVYLFGSSSFIKDGVSCGYSLQTYAIEKAKRDSVKRYDLFGVDNKHLSKLITFKSSFGGELVNRTPSFDYYYNYFIASSYRVVEDIRFKLRRG